jgi:hypothetical protein
LALWYHRLQALYDFGEEKPKLEGHKAPWYDYTMCLLSIIIFYVSLYCYICTDIWHIFLRLPYRAIVKMAYYKCTCVSPNMSENMMRVGKYFFCIICHWKHYYNVLYIVMNVEYFINFAEN